MNFSHKKYNIPLRLCQSVKAPKKKPFSYSKAQQLRGIRLSDLPAGQIWQNMEGEKTGK
jgi:hypothetical protein